jgi:hypothetical protein
MFARVLSVGVLGLSGLAACSDDAAESTQSSAPPDTVATTDSIADSIDDDPAPTTSGNVSTTDAAELLPLPFGTLEPGAYAGNRFENPVTLTVGEGWRFEESFGILSLVEDLADDSGGGIGIIDIASEMSADEVLDRLVDREGITFSDPEPTSITGLDGVVVTADAPTEVILYRFLQDSQSGWGTAPGVRSEVHIVEAPTGTRLIWIEAPAERFESFRPTAQSVIDSIVWEE